MTTGANFPIQNRRMQWWKSLISGDPLLIQDHEARIHARQGNYEPYQEYGNPFAITISSEISETERDMRLGAETKECSLQDERFVDCIVDPESITIDGTVLDFNYQLIKADGGVLDLEFGEPAVPPEEPEHPEILFYNFITEGGDNFVTEDGDNFITEFES
ncbi:hypothetical protein KAR91_00705 [Candidatus Pacearchaeota archaeon]|nr:hypothetical protein [Candidatus Pacearchaeota archaeon]